MTANATRTGYRWATVLFLIAGLYVGHSAVQTAEHLADERAMQELFFAGYLAVACLVGSTAFGMHAWFSKELIRFNTTARTDLANSEMRRVESEERLKTITDHLSVLIAYIDKNEVCRFANAKYEEWFGVAPNDIVGKSAEQVLGAELYSLWKIQFKRNLAGEAFDFETISVVRNSRCTVHLHGRPDIEDGTVKGAYLMMADISKKKEQEQWQEQMLARHVMTTAIAPEMELPKFEILTKSDVLTGLPNRRSYEDKFAGAALRAVRAQTPLTLMVVDLDRFAELNMNLGHMVGDAVLKEVAMRLRLCIRSTDMAFRVGGDEFVVIAEEMSSPVDAEELAKKIMFYIALPIYAQENKLLISTSIGIAWSTPTTAEIGLFDQAERALYNAKREGRNRYSMAAA